MNLTFWSEATIRVGPPIYYICTTYRSSWTLLKQAWLCFIWNFINFYFSRENNNLKLDVKCRKAAILLRFLSKFSVLVFLVFFEEEIAPCSRSPVAIFYWLIAEILVRRSCTPTNKNSCIKHACLHLAVSSSQRLRYQTMKTAAW